MKFYTGTTSDSDIKVTAEQHALDNPGHVLAVSVGKGEIDLTHDDFSHTQRPTLDLTLSCISCGWWDEQVYYGDTESGNEHD